MDKRRSIALPVHLHTPHLTVRLTNVSLQISQLGISCEELLVHREIVNKPFDFARRL